jgi:hypothetical protein
MLFRVAAKEARCLYQNFQTSTSDQYNPEIASSASDDEGEEEEDISASDDEGEEADISVSDDEGAGEDISTSADERAGILEFYKNYGVCITAYDDIDLFTLPLKTSLCPVGWDRMAEMVFMEGLATKCVLLDLSMAIRSRTRFLKQVHGHEFVANYDFVSSIIGEWRLCQSPKTL